jgi:uncharacterized protein (DUF1330 family)
MQVENALYPKRECVAALAAETDPAAIVMLNLLKFRDLAEYPDRRPTTLSGREAYTLYGDAMRRIVEETGGRFLFYGIINELVIGQVGELWDAAALVQYPSSAAFAHIATLPQVEQIGVHRAAGLKGQLLIRIASPQSRLF